MNNAAALLALSDADLAAFTAPPAAAPEDAPSVAPYDVAHALRAVVARDGTVNAKALFVAYEAINRAVFGGALPPATLLWTAPGSPRAYADHIGVDEHGIRFRIRVSPSIRKYGMRFVLDVVMHEMVHVACSFLDHDDEPGYRGHGPKFAARCNAIGAMLGLAEVAAKGKRSGKPDCAQWPLNVRPLGYYGENDPRTVKTKAPDAGNAGEGDDPTDDGSERKPSRAERYEAAMRKAMTQIEQGNPGSAWALLNEALA